MTNFATQLYDEPFDMHMQKETTVEFFDIEIDGFTNDALAKFADENGYLTKNLDLVVKNKEQFSEVSVLSTYAKYESDNGKYPAIQIRIIDDKGHSIYYSPVYVIGSDIEFYRREWRIPPAFDRYKHIRLSFLIPDGVRLKLRDIKVKHNYNYRERDIGIRYHGHAGATTALGFQLTAEVGFTSCITIPKFTKDGIGVCFHDDLSVIGEARLDDGSKIEEGSAFDKPVSEFTYEELMNLNVWRKRSDAYAGMRVPTMEEFFRICSTTGMQPIFSVHPQLTKDQWLYVRELLIKYRLLEHFWVKSNKRTTHALCKEVFDDEIAGYILLQGAKDDWTPDEMVSLIGLDKNRHNIVIEFFNHIVTAEKIKAAKEEGYYISIAAMKGGVSGPRMQNLIDLGVTEFTVDHHCSMGLCW
jgi:hypothetical protein